MLYATTLLNLLAARTLIIFHFNSWLIFRLLLCMPRAQFLGHYEYTNIQYRPVPFSWLLSFDIQNDNRLNINKTFSKHQPFIKHTDKLSKASLWNNGRFSMLNGCNTWYQNSWDRPWWMGTDEDSTKSSPAVPNVTVLPLEISLVTLHYWTRHCSDNWVTARVEEHTANKWRKWGVHQIWSGSWLTYTHLVNCH